MELRATSFPSKAARVFIASFRPSRVVHWQVSRLRGSHTGLTHPQGLGEAGPHGSWARRGLWAGRSRPCGLGAWGLVTCRCILVDFRVSLPQLLLWGAVRAAGVAPAEGSILHREGGPGGRGAGCLPVKEEQQEGEGLGVGTGLGVQASVSPCDSRAGPRRPLGTHWSERQKPGPPQSRRDSQARECEDPGAGPGQTSGHFPLLLTVWGEA